MTSFWLLLFYYNFCNLKKLRKLLLKKKILFLFLIFSLIGLDLLLSHSLSLSHSAMVQGLTAAGNLHSTLDPPPPSPWHSVAGAPIHFPNPEDTIEVFVDGYFVKVLKGLRNRQCQYPSILLPQLPLHRQKLPHVPRRGREYA